MNRVEDYLITMTHTFDHNINEQIKELCELNEHVENIIKQLDILKKKLMYSKESKSDFSRLSTKRVSSRILKQREPSYMNDLNNESVNKIEPSLKRSLKKVMSI